MTLRELSENDLINDKTALVLRDDFKILVNTRRWSADFCLYHDCTVESFTWEPTNTVFVDLILKGDEKI